MNASAFSEYFDRLADFAERFDALAEEAEEFSVVPDGVRDGTQDLGAAQLVDFAISQALKAERRIQKASHALVAALAARRGAVLVAAENRSKK